MGCVEPLASATSAASGELLPGLPTLTLLRPSRTLRAAGFCAQRYQHRESTNSTRVSHNVIVVISFAAHQATALFKDTCDPYHARQPLLLLFDTLVEKNNHLNTPDRGFQKMERGMKPGKETG